MDTAPEEFGSAVEEATYWKQAAEEYLQKLQDARDEFDEFQQGSQELEAELEVQLEQYEAKVNELVSAKDKLEEENHTIKEKLETLERDSYIQVSELQDENVKIKTVSEEMQKYIRELEQCNDDLERSKRATISSLEEFDSRLNNAIERNAFLENELEEKEQLIITVQRLKDESRDLKGELAKTSTSLTKPTRKTSLNETKTKLDERPTTTNNADTSVASTAIDVKKLPAMSPLQRTENASDAIRGKKTGIPIQNHTAPVAVAPTNQMSPSARISALNIVSDLLRKVGALESKLARCRNFVQDHPGGGGGATSPHMLFGAPSLGEHATSLPNGVASDASSTSITAATVKANV